MTSSIFLRSVGLGLIRIYILLFLAWCVYRFQLPEYSFLPCLFTIIGSFTISFLVAHSRIRWYVLFLGIMLATLVYLVVLRIIDISVPITYTYLDFQTSLFRFYSIPLIEVGYYTILSTWVSYRWKGFYYLEIPIMILLFFAVAIPLQKQTWDILLGVYDIHQLLIISLCFGFGIIIYMALSQRKS